MVEIGHFSSQLFILCKVSGEEFGLRVEWSDLAIFKIFKKLHVSLIRYIFRRLNRKNRRISLRGKIYIFKKCMDLKNEYFLKLCKILPYISKNNCQK